MKTQIGVLECLVFHKDLKLENVLIDTNGKVYLVDFGLAEIIMSEGELFRSREYFFN